MLSDSRVSSFLVAASALFAACGDARPNARPNVILVSLDTCRADRLGFLGAARPTPVLDRLALESIVFEDCFAQSSATAPSHQSIFTGQTVQRHGLMANGQSREPLYSIASCLKSVGYQTAAFTGHGSLQKKFGHGFGFDVFVSWDEENAVEGAPYQRMLSEAAGEALQWLDERLDDSRDAEPFFLFVHGYDPHLPYWPDEPLRSEFAGWYTGSLDVEDLRKKDELDAIISSGAFGPSEARYMSDLYDAEIAESDSDLGTFLDELRARGLYEDTLIVFTSDHGELLGEHDWVGHGVFFEEVARVPLLVRMPGGELACRRPDPVQHTDILPTILGVAGVPVPRGVQGTDLVSVVRGETALPSDRMRVGRRLAEVALRFADEPDWRVIFKQGRGGLREVQIYDGATDPGELVNIAETEPVRTRFSDLYARYVAWTKETAKEDGLYRGEGSGIQPEDIEMLQDLGYLGEDESGDD